MSYENVVGIILAAGRSSRTRDFNKLTASIGGRPMVSYAVRHLREAGVKKIVAVVGHDQEKVKQAIGHGVEWALQPEQSGTGNAALQALPFIRTANQIVVLYGDCPFLDAPIIRDTLSFHINASADLTVASSRVPEATAWGHICRGDDNELLSITDGRLQPPDKRETEVFVGLSIWTKRTFELLVPKLPLTNLPGHSAEYNLPDAITLAHRNGLNISCFSGIDRHDATAPNTDAEFHMAADYIRRKKIGHLASSGVSFDDMDSTSIDYDVIVTPACRIFRDVRLLGRTTVEEDCQIGPDATLLDCTVRRGSKVRQGIWEGKEFPEGSLISDGLRGRQLYFRRPHYEVLKDPRMCFGILPFISPYKEFFNNIIVPEIEYYGYHLVIADAGKIGFILDHIWEDINRAALIIAETTADNPNVWFECGLAHAMNKNVIMFRRTGVAMPFDVGPLRMILYDPQAGDAAPQLRKFLHELGKVRT